MVAITTGSYQSWANSVLVLTSKCQRDPYPNQVDRKIHPDSPLQGLQPLVPLGGTEMGGRTPLTEVANLLPPVEEANQPLLLKVGHQPPQGLY